MCKLKPTPSELRLLPKAKELVDFKWDKVETELSEKAPTLSLIPRLQQNQKMEKEKLNLASLGW